MGNIAWDYSILTVLALGAGVGLFVWLTRFERKPLDAVFERLCPRCKLITKGEGAKSFIHCPFCTAKYPPL